VHYILSAVAAGPVAIPALRGAIDLTKQPADGVTAIKGGLAVNHIEAKDSTVVSTMRVFGEARAFSLMHQYPRLRPRVFNVTRGCRRSRIHFLLCPIDLLCTKYEATISTSETQLPALPCLMETKAVSFDSLLTCGQYVLRRRAQNQL